VEHKTALQWAVERVASLGNVHLVRHLLDITSTPAHSSSKHRADSVEHLLNVACSLPALDDHLGRHLVQLITDHGCRRLSTTTVVV